ncbi:MAG: hypothetical protein WD876_02690 [Candidatus Pacearchaeota archaeon]
MITNKFGSKTEKKVLMHKIDWLEVSGNFNKSLIVKNNLNATEDRIISE